jgi:hypothetical protein
LRLLKMAMRLLRQKKSMMYWCLAPRKADAV